MQRKAAAAILIWGSCSGRDPLWQKLQPAQGETRQLPIVLLVGGLGGCLVLGNNSFQFSVFKNKPVESR